MANGPATKHRELRVSPDVRTDAVTLHVVTQPRTVLVDYVKFSAVLAYQLCAQLRGTGVHATVITDRRETAQCIYLL